MTNHDDLRELADWLDWARPRQLGIPRSEPLREAIAALDRAEGVVVAARGLAELPEDDLRDYEQALCFFCGEGWEAVPGPRGGKPRMVRTNRHSATCPVAALLDAIRAYEDADKEEVQP